MTGPALRSLLHRLEEQGHRLTPTRLAVVAAVLDRRGHFSVDDILGQIPGVTPQLASEIVLWRQSGEIRCIAGSTASGATPPLP